MAAGARGSAHELACGLDALRRAVAAALCEAGRLSAGVALPAREPAMAGAQTPPSAGWLWSETASPAPPGRHDDRAYAASSEADEADQTRLIALVELARDGDKEAFGQLYDHYHVSVFRFLYYRTRSQTLAEDLTSETFFRALRRMNSFTWQGKDFGAWLMTIARNLATDHFKSGRNRLESVTEDMSIHDDVAEGPENAVLQSLTNEVLLKALAELSEDQRDCLVMRFLQGLSIAETADAIGKSQGAVKQLQLRAVRNLAKSLPEGIRD